MLLPSLSGDVPDRADAVRVDGDAISREALRAAAGAVAAEIAGAGTVAVLATPSVATVAAIVGGLLSGVAVVPVPPDTGAAELAHVLTDSGAQLLLAGEPDAPVLAGCPIPVVPVDSGRRGEVPTSGPAPSTTGLILYTSGTTGPPKGVLLSHAAIRAGIDAVAHAWDWTDEDVLVQGLPLYHVHGLILGLLGPLRVGSPLVHTRRPTPARYAAAGGSLYFGVPTVWSRICAEPTAARALSAARLLVSGSAPLPAPVFAELEGLTGHRPVERYGMTETLITLSTRADGPRRVGSVGRPVRGVQARLVDDAGAPVPADGQTFGALQIRGETLFDGYLHLPDKTAETFTADGWFRTGDVATVSEAGEYRIVGRASADIIKSGGYRIGAGEIEDCLLTHPQVREVAVVGAPHDDLGQEVVAFIVGEQSLAARTLVTYVEKRLARHKRPRRVHLVESLPRNALGKVQKTTLLSLMESGTLPGGN
ncbi:AMP-binding protein [Micromonospora zamorensis]|uniref:AMP-binding protein n=1 Tax=Micromonospora zamorensis TaxID=709883 RepID=UPI003D99A0E9